MEVKTANEFKNGIQFRKYLEDLLLSLNPVLPDDEMERKNTMTALDVLTECAFPSKKIIPIISAHHLDPPRHKSNIKQPEQLSHIQLEYMTRQPTRPRRVDMPSNNTVVCSGDDSLAILLKDLSLSDDDFDIDYDKINFNDKISFNVNWDEVLNEMSLSSGDSQMTNKTEESDIPANLHPNKPTQTAILNSVACNTELLQSTTFKDTVFVPANCMTPNIFGNVSTINLFTPDDADTTFVTSNIHNPFPTIPDDLLTPCILTKHHEGVQPKTPEPKKRKRVIKKPVQRRALYTEVDLSSSSSNSSWPTNAAENITPTESQQNIKKCRNVKTVHQKEMMLGNIFPFRREHTIPYKVMEYIEQHYSDLKLEIRHNKNAMFRENLPPEFRAVHLEIKYKLKMNGVIYKEYSNDKSWSVKNVFCRHCWDVCQTPEDIANILLDDEVLGVTAPPPPAAQAVPVVDEVIVISDDDEDIEIIYHNMQPLEPDDGDSYEDFVRGLEAPQAKKRTSSIRQRGRPKRRCARRLSFEIITDEETTSEEEGSVSSGGYEGDTSCSTASTSTSASSNDSRQAVWGSCLEEGVSYV
ncbi:hypothetical protein V9T40_003542 [Parthenolecanium corni]|uniref:Uncharacterized protein n=1 Tax=Parthenolecanium corni TaxID=536013 RepID=A0AAN9Y826_9HEMI